MVEYVFRDEHKRYDNGVDGKDYQIQLDNALTEEELYQKVFFTLYLIAIFAILTL